MGIKAVPIDAGPPDMHRTVPGLRSFGKAGQPRHAARMAVLRRLKSAAIFEATETASEPDRILAGLIWPQRLLDLEADRVGSLGFPVAETYLRAAGLSVGHAATYLRRGLDAERRGVPPPDAPSRPLDWL